MSLNIWIPPGVAGFGQSGAWHKSCLWFTRTFVGKTNILPHMRTRVNQRRRPPSLNRWGKCLYHVLMSPKIKFTDVTGPTGRESVDGRPIVTEREISVALVPHDVLTNWQTACILSSRVPQTTLQMSWRALLQFISRPLKFHANV